MLRTVIFARNLVFTRRSFVRWIAEALAGIAQTVAVAVVLAFVVPVDHQAAVVTAIARLAGTATLGANTVVRAVVQARKEALTSIAEGTFITGTHALVTGSVLAAIRWAGVHSNYKGQ